jgi:hypothetical protein
VGRDAEGGLDPPLRQLVLSVDALRVDLQQHVHAVACPLGYLRRWNACDFVSSGMPALSKLARPRLRFLGLDDWVNEVAREQGLRSVTSSAGRQAAVLSGLWGSRQALAAAIAGPLRFLFKAYTPSRGARGSDAYPNQEGVVLRDEGYLSFEGMVKVLAGRMNVAELRLAVDDLLRRRIVRRGLIIRCRICDWKAFTAVDKVGQRNQCDRCDAPSDLVSENWISGIDEPVWHYDLHGALRELLRHNGDVPLLLAHYLRSTTRRYFDTAEIEFERTASREAIAECDLVALVDQSLVVAEAKEPGDLGKAPAAVVRKRIALAQCLGADQIVFATAAPVWNQRSMDMIRGKIHSEQWELGQIPGVRLISGLGTDQITDERLNLYDGGRVRWR